MSPFKGQGANQALIDALFLARAINRGCGKTAEWQHKGLRSAVLNGFEAEMLARSAVKVLGSKEAVAFLHSDEVLAEADAPRGSCLPKNKFNA